MREIKSSWEKRLDLDRKSFDAQCERVKSWDLLLLKAHEEYIALMLDLCRIDNEQAQIKGVVRAVGHQQESMLRTPAAGVRSTGILQELEDLCRELGDNAIDSVSGSYNPRASQMQSAELDQRRRNFELAGSIHAELSGMRRDLDDIVSHPNKSAKVQQRRDTPEGQVMMVLNRHLQAMQNCESNSQQLQAQLAVVNQHMQSLERHGQ